MSHEVESIAWSGEAPWHGLGVNVPVNVTVEEMLKAAKLDWEVEKVAIQTADEGVTIPGQYAIRRATDKVVYDVVSPRWKPVQNREILSFFKEWTEAGDATIEVAGSLRNGKQVWALADLKMGFTLPGGDETKGKVLMTGSHESGRATLILPTGVRVVCANTMAMALAGNRKGEVRWNHSRDFDAEQAKEMLGLSKEAIVAQGKAAKTLSKLKMDINDMIAVLAPIFQPNEEVAVLQADHDNFAPTMKNIFWAKDNAPGAIKDLTAWSVLNGVTFALDHLQKATPDGKFFASNFGHQAANKQKVFASLLELAA